MSRRDELLKYLGGKDNGAMIEPMVDEVVFFRTAAHRAAEAAVPPGSPAQPGDSESNTGQPDVCVPDGAVQR